jgi:hypothetical protein
LRSIFDRFGVSGSVAIARPAEQDSNAPRARLWKMPRIRRSYPMTMIIELGKVTENTKGIDFGLKVDSNVGAKVQRYNTAF